MSAIDNQPESTNFLSQLGFRFLIERIPNVNYFCQAAEIPGISINSVDSNTPFTVIPHAGSRLTFNPLDLKFVVDENIANYLEIYNWLVGMGRPDSFQQTVDFAKQSHGFASRIDSVQKMESDGTLLILDGDKNPKIQVFFEAMFPVSISGLSFNSTDSDVQYIEATAQFRYRKFSFEKLK